MHWSRPVLVVGIAVVATATVAVLLRPWADEEPRPAAPVSTSERASELTTLVARTAERVARVPGDWRAWADLGMARVQLARVSADPAQYPRAEEALRRSPDLRADGNAPVLTGMAAVGDKAGARADLAEALRITPRFAPRTSAQAHPLGNFTTNQYAGLRVTPDAVDVDYVLDLAELPAFQVRRDEVDTDTSGKVSPVEGTVYAERTCGTVAGLTVVGVDGRPVPVVAKAAGFRQVPGTGGLATIRVECALRAVVTIGAQSTVEFRVDAFADRTGWREITAVGDRMTLARSSVPADTVSERLHVYPPELAPPDVRTARLVVRPGGPAAGPAPGLAAETNRADLMTAWFGDLIGRPHLGLGIGILALFLAIVLGAAHAGRYRSRRRPRTAG